MSFVWRLEFETPAQVIGNLLGVVIGVVALVVFVRGLLSGRGLRWRDLLLLGNVTIVGVAFPVFQLAWLFAEWVASAPEGDGVAAPVIVESDELDVESGG